MFLQSITVGLTSSLTTLITQAYGAHDLRLCGIYSNRQGVINFSVIFFLSLILLWVYDIYIFIGQDPDVARNASIYVRCAIPGQMFYSQYCCQQRLLYGQRNFIIPMYATITATVAHLIVVLTLVYGLGWDMWAIAIASSFQFFVRYLVTKICMERSDSFKESNQPFWNAESVRNLGP
mmetsp:Transcript_38177/g.36534  ORF Transcript_38177/g.36534 Transcript_38177/m.36534 type:complete len:178 (-) Transcript_38177:65-598(-)